MKISIIIPIYKVEKEIERCITSVLTQDYSNIEIVLVNDCTPDLSFKIAKDCIQLQQAENKTLFVEHKINQGLSCARNTGLEKCTGDYVFFLDSDDALTDSRVISYLVSYIKNDPSLEVVMGNYQKVDEQGVYEVAHEVRRLFANNDEIYGAYTKGLIRILACSKLIKKEFLIRNRLFFKEGIYHEDELWSFELFRVLTSIYVSPRIIYDYYKRKDSITSHLKEKNIEDWITVITEMSNILLEQPKYYKKETIWVIERHRREALKKIFYFTDRKWMIIQIQRLQIITMPFTYKKRVVKQKLLMMFPSIFIYGYLKFKYKKYRKH
ncbi:glycosyltransferase family 2 protein [Ignatzschineria sp. LJL83]